MQISEDAQAERLIEINIARVSATLNSLTLDEPVSAIALIVPDEPEAMEPVALSVCGAARWRRLRGPKGQTASIEVFMHLFSPDEWDHHDRDVLPSDAEAEFQKLSAVVFARWGDNADPSMQILTETARRLATDPPIPAESELVAFATDLHFGDDMLESIRTASNAPAKAMLNSAGLLPTSLDALVL